MQLGAKAQQKLKLFLDLHLSLTMPSVCYYVDQKMWIGVPGRWV